MDHPACSWQSTDFTPELEDFAINAACQFFANSHGYCAKRAYKGRNRVPSRKIETSLQVKQVVLKVLNVSGTTFETLSAAPGVE